MARAARFKPAPYAEDLPDDPETGAGEWAPSTNVVRASFGLPEAAEQTALIREVWGDAILAEPAKVEAILHAQGVIAEENTTMLGAAINMGRALLEARAQLTEGEFRRGLRASRKAWHGWSASNISKLMAVAAFCDRHRFPQQQVPQSYTTLYEFAALPDEQFQRTVEIGLFRPDVRRSDIQAFKHKLAEGTVDLSRNASETCPYEEEAERLGQRLRYLDGEAEKVRRRLKEVRQLVDQWRRDRKGSGK
jgi:hypothetical protein